MISNNPRQTSWLWTSDCTDTTAATTETTNTMATITDPLLALKSAIQEKAPISYKNNGSPAPNLSNATHIVLSPTVSFPKNTPTRLRNSGRTSASTSASQDPQTNPSAFFSLEAVCLAWLLRDASAADYVRQAREHGLVTGFVSITERKSLVDWLEGRTSTHEKIVPLASECHHMPR